MSVAVHPQPFLFLLPAVPYCALLDRIPCEASAQLWLSLHMSSISSYAKKLGTVTVQLCRSGTMWLAKVAVILVAMFPHDGNF